MEQIAFLSYSHHDNKREGEHDVEGRLPRFRTDLQNRIRASGHPHFQIFMDIDGIPLGVDWKHYIRRELRERALFLIPLLSASYFKSEPCRDELTHFLDKMGQEDRSEWYVVPIEYNSSCERFWDGTSPDPLAERVHKMNLVHWQDLRHQHPGETGYENEMKRLVDDICKKIETIEAL